MLSRLLKLRVKESGNMEFKVEKRDMIMMGIRSTYYKVEADSAEEAEQKVIDNCDDCDAYDADYDIEQTELLEFIIEEN